jgi:hypothetical protein
MSPLGVHSTIENVGHRYKKEPKLKSISRSIISVSPMAESISDSQDDGAMNELKDKLPQIGRSRNPA